MARERQLGQLILVRHGQTEWNALGRWQGLADVQLTAAGRAEAQRVAALLRDVPVAIVYTSALQRARETAALILDGLGLVVPVVVSAELNERDYGALTGEPHARIRAHYGEEQYERWHRGWDEPVPGGETARALARRVVAYYEVEIRPRARTGDTVLLVGHRGSLRVLMKHLDGIPDVDFDQVEIGNGEVRRYEIR